MQQHEQLIYFIKTSFKLNVLNCKIVKIVFALSFNIKNI